MDSALHVSAYTILYSQLIKQCSHSLKSTVVSHVLDQLDYIIAQCSVIVKNKCEISEVSCQSC